MSADSSPPTQPRMACAECGQNVGIAERHTFVDCSLYVVTAGRCDDKYAKALAYEVRRLREENKRWRNNFGHVNP